MLVAFLAHSIQMSQPPTRAHAQETPRYMPAPSIISPPGSACKSQSIGVLRSAAHLPRSDNGNVFIHPVCSSIEFSPCIK